MNKPILYGVYLSPPVRGVLLVAKAIGLDLEFREVNLLANENLTPEFIEKNPQHTVPTLDDNGLFIWDSHAIATYLIGKYAQDDSLYPRDLYKRALVDQRLHFDSGILFVRLSAISKPIIFFGEKEIPQQKLDALEEAYDLMNKFLCKDFFLVGDTLTAADLCSISCIASAQGVLPVNAEKYPKLAGWMKRMEELPYYEETSGKYSKELIEFINNKLYNNNIFRDHSQ